MKNKKILLVFLCLVLCLVSLTGCGNKDQGGFEDIDVSDEKPKERVSLFTQAEDTLGYKYQLVKCGRTGVAFNVPADWTVEVENGRHILIQAPESDPHLPGMSLHYYAKLQVPEDNETLQVIGQYDTFFDYDMEITKYNFKGTQYSLYSEFKPDKMYTDTSITGGDDKLTSLAYSSYPFLMAYTMDPLPESEDPGLFAYYINWYNTPTLFTCAFHNADYDKAEALLQYVVSSMQKYEPAETLEYADYEINGLKLSLPSEFEVISDDLTYGVPLTNLGTRCGFTVSVYDSEELSEEEFRSIVEKNAANVFSKAAQANINVHYEPMHSPSASIEKLAEDGSFMKTYNYTVLRQHAYEYSETLWWNDYYNGVQTLYTTFFYYDTGKDAKIITFTWPTDRMEEALKIEETIEISIKNNG